LSWAYNLELNEASAKLFRPSPVLIIAVRNLIPIGPSAVWSSLAGRQAQSSIPARVEREPPRWGLGQQHRACAVRKRERRDGALAGAAHFVGLARILQYRGRRPARAALAISPNRRSLLTQGAAAKKASWPWAQKPPKHACSRRSVQYATTPP